jgi:hypothetical protein
MKSKCRACGLEIEATPLLEGKPFAFWLAVMITSAVCWLVDRSEPR